MTVATAAENSTSEAFEEPPMKKQKVEGGAAVATASADSTDLSTEDVKVTKGRSRKRKRSKKKMEFKIPCHEMPLFIAKDYSCILWNYMQKIKGVANPKLVFKTTVDTAIKIPQCRYYVTTCTVKSVKGSLSGRGRARTKKRSRQKACLQIIQRQGLVPKATIVDTMAVTLPPPPVKKAAKIKPIIEYDSYLTGNFKGALERYLRRNDLGFKVTQKCEWIRTEKGMEHLTTCTGSKGKHKGRGRHKHKKKSIQLAWLHFILDMKLISKEQHQEKHPPAPMVEKEEEKSKDAGKPSKSLMSAAVKEQLSEKKEKNKSLCDASSEQAAPVVNQDVAESKESEVDQSVDEPSKKMEEDKQKVDEPSSQVDEQKEDAQQSTSIAIEKEENVNEKQTADEVSEMEVETKEKVDELKDVAQQSTSIANEKEENVHEKQTADEVSEMEVEIKEKVDDQKEDAQQSTSKANDKEENVNEKQIADEVSKMEVETKAATDTSSK